MEIKEEIKNQAKEIMESTSRVQEHIEAFDTFFEAEVAKRTNKKVLESLFNDFIDIAYKHTTLYKFMMDKMVNIDTDFRPTLTNKQKELFDAYEYLTDTITDDFGLQSFVYGFALGQQLQIDSNNAMNEILSDLKKKLDGNDELTKNSRDN